MSPLGDVIVWYGCVDYAISCEIYRATRAGASWVTALVTSNPASAFPASPATDGAVIVYDATRDGEQDIYWQPVGGGPEEHLELPGRQYNLSVSGGVIVFASETPDSATDLFVYRIATNSLFRLTDTQGQFEELPDVVVLGDGRVRVVWDTYPRPCVYCEPERDVRGAEFELPDADETPPTVACDVPLPGPVFVLGGAGGFVSATVTDSGSGPVAASVSAPANVSSVGDKTVSLTGRDVAGNETTIDCPYRVVYDFGGFRQPVDPLPTLNSLKAGAAVPVKFSLGGFQGLAIFAAGYPKSQVIACDSTAPVDGVEQTVTAGASGLSYDATLDVYTYVWKTDKAWAGTCRQLVLKLADGIFYRANFMLK